LRRPVDPGDVGDRGEHERHADHRGAGDVQSGNRTGQVHRDDHEEEGREDRKEAPSVLLAEQVFGDADAHEVEAHLDERLAATGNDLHAPRAEPEHHDDDDGHQDADQHDAVQLEWRAGEEHHRREELTDIGTDEAASGVAFSGEREDQIESVE
jgi:hypothetical protein